MPITTPFLLEFQGRNKDDMLGVRNTRLNRSEQSTEALLFVSLFEKLLLIFRIGTETKIYQTDQTHQQLIKESTKNKKTGVMLYGRCLHFKNCHPTFSFFFKFPSEIILKTSDFQNCKITVASEKHFKISLHLCIIIFPYFSNFLLMNTHIFF